MEKIRIPDAKIRIRAGINIPDPQHWWKCIIIPTFNKRDIMIIFHMSGWRGGAVAHDAAGGCGQELSRPCGHLLSQGKHSLNLIIRLQ
jgi:hypothetical protein